MNFLVIRKDPAGSYSMHLDSGQLHIICPRQIREYEPNLTFVLSCNFQYLCMVSMGKSPTSTLKAHSNLIILFPLLRDLGWTLLLFLTILYMHEHTQMSTSITCC